MEQIKKDILALKQLVNKGVSTKQYSRVYSHTNENLKAIIENFDIKNKSILTVLGSGDQALNFLNHKAANVELFDINKLALYYYYIRLWTIKYYNHFYLGTKLIDLLKLVKPKDKAEEKAFFFWINYYKRFGNNINFFHNDGAPFTGRIKDLSYLRKRLEKEKIVFYNIDLTEKVHLNKKYDIIYVSNVPRWIVKEDLITCIDGKESILLDNYRENLDRLLKKDGKVICANVSRTIDENDIEVEYMSKSFDFHQLNETDDICYPKIPGYYYTKKKKK